ncbi:annexin D4 [Cornus florida]|uniref:annexin D4 n=1 Tax=Cornus florida TaxID=4283 RepID=UPI002899798C|nr:annexin D4 [Cornus florida]
MGDISHDFEAVTKAFSGFGVDEISLISTLGKWHHEERKSFRKGAPQFFTEDDRLFERWNDGHIAQLQIEFLRFKNAMVLWTMHPWERDARLLKEALTKGPESYRLLIEVACTRSSEELFGARRAYHSLFDHSMEEDVAYHINGPERKLFVALVSSYRYEGQRVNDATAKSEAKTLGAAIKNANKKKPIEDEEVVRILATRSKLHLKAIFRHYKEMCGKNIDEDLEADLILKDTVQCLCIPQTYFSKVLDASVEASADENAKEALTRVIVTRADVDMKEINEEHLSRYGYTLSDMLEDRANGNFKDFLHALVARGG